ncbi:hypothetical protein ACFO0M_07385 [Micromonospora mangrovi]|uniref:DUF1800 domain-containing protein n=2 Tax=Micromonospora TaxID=1873 RepID=A0AAU7M819_9ACTN
MSGAGAPPGRLLLAPVTVSPTKPLTPSHLKLLLSVDVLHRATSTLTDVTFLYRPLAHAGSRQIAGFWEFLDRRHPGTSYDDWSEERIGDAYGEFQRAERVPYARLEPLVRRAAAGWVHPVSRRVVDLWHDHYRRLALTDPMEAPGPTPMPLDELIDLLLRHGLCVDGRPFGAPVYLDATPAGLPLRTLVGADGHANYLASTLAELLPLRAGHDHVVLPHDVEIRTDYRTLAYVLTRLGTPVSRIEFPRVPLDGTARATRYGGWHAYTVDALAARAAADGPVFALGLRLYLIAGLGRTARESFDRRQLDRWLRRAERLLAGGVGAADPVALAALAGRLPYVDPYRLVTSMLGRTGGAAAGDLLAVVLGADAFAQPILSAS